MRTAIILLFLISWLPGAKVVESYWEKGQTFSDYLFDRSASVNFLGNIDPEDKELLSEIRSGQKFFELLDRDGTLLQALIPIGEEMQIQVVYEGKDEDYSFDIIPISYVKREHKAIISIQNNPQTDVDLATNNRKLSDRVYYFFKDNVDSRRLQKNDKLAVIYEQKERLGKPFGPPDIKIAMIETRNKKQFIYANNDGEPTTKTSQAITYDRAGNIISAAQIRQIKRKQKFGMPLRHIRISSRFTHKRWHPILHRYRPHLGTDFAARRGTPILAVNSGRVTFAGRKGGYGKVVKIKHRGGYTSLYAHQSRIRAKRGRKVEKGQIIGYVGNTGRSTGPHLHFGLYKNGRAIDPMKVLKKKGSGGLKSFITKKVKIKGIKKNRARIIKMLQNPPVNFKWDFIEKNYTLLNDRVKYLQEDKG